MIDLTGKRFGNLLVLSRAEIPNKQAAWRCRCDCGNETVVLGWNLRSGHTISCGCVHKTALKNGLRSTHGMIHSRLYGIWEDMFNTVNADIFGAFNEATMTIVTTALGFDAFVDGAAMLNLENLEGVTIFGFVNPADMAKLRKALKDDLKYVEAYAKQGYVGTVGGINIYTKKNAETGKMVIATKEAVTLFNKKGTEVEQEREGNIRRNTVYSRKYYLAAMTNEAKAVKIITGSAAVTADTTVSSDKTYYAASGIGYVKVTPGSGDNPKTKGWYEITAA